MRGDTNFKGSDSSDPTVYSLYCGFAISNCIHVKCSFTVNEFPLGNAFDFSGTNHQFLSSSFVNVFKILTNFALEKFLKYNYVNHLFACNV